MHMGVLLHPCMTNGILMLPKISFGRKGEKDLPDVSQFVYPQKTLFKFWQNIIFNWQVKLRFSIFILCNQDQEDQARILVQILFFQC